MKDKLTIEVEKKFQFGDWRYFPINDVALSLMSLFPRRKVFYKKDLDVLETLDFQVKVIVDESLEG